MPTLLTEKRNDGVGLITLNRPDSLNSFGEDMLPRLSDALDEWEADPEVRCIALTGAGRGFSSGGDVKGMAATAARTGPRPSFGRMIRGAHRSQRDSSLRIHTYPKPVVGLLNGAAAGGGLGLALSCDFRIASDRARLVPAFRNVGVGGDYGIAWFLQQIVGNALAREILLLNRVLSADEALALHLVTKVVPHDDVMTEGLAFCAELAQGPTDAFGFMKRNLNRSTYAWLDDVLWDEGTGVILGFQTEDHKEAARAFVEKRAPAFHGR